jgi:hypothetical protein
VTTRRPPSLPDITDDDFRRRLDPLARAVVPGSTATEAREPDSPANTRDPKAPALTSLTVEGRAGEGRTAPPDNRITDDPVYRNEVEPSTTSHSARRPGSSLADRIAAVTQMEVVLAARGPKKGVEFLLPERVISALKIAAGQEGTSMTVKVLEALRGAGYPITDADFVDLRKLPKR